MRNWLFIIISFISVYTIISVSCKNTSKEKTKEEIASEAEMLINVNKYLVSKDADIIRAYAKRRGWTITTTKTGLAYVIINEGFGKAAQTGKTAVIKYNVSMLDGTVCYSSDSLEPKTFRIGKGGVESGLEEAILLMHEGGKGFFIMPPHLAHGLMGDQNKIPARATILYEVELVKLY